MQANACAARRCRSLTLTTCFAAALELPKLFSKAKSNAKAAAKQVRAMRGQRRVAQALACICVICGFPFLMCTVAISENRIYEQGISSDKKTAPEKTKKEKHQA